MTALGKIQTRTMKERKRERGLAVEDLLNTHRMPSSVLTFVPTWVLGQEKHKEEACLNWTGLCAFTKTG